MTSKLDDLLKTAAGKQTAENLIDRKNQIQKWNQEIQKLYTQVEQWLKSSIQKKYVTVEKKPIVLEEENLGKYNVESLEIHIGKGKIIFEPIGMLIIGARGRIDVTGPYGRKEMLLLLGDNETPGVRVTIHIPGQTSETIKEEISPPPKELIWKLAIKNPNLKVVPLSESIFEELMERLLS
jgi:hypothetical protein